MKWPQSLSFQSTVFPHEQQRTIPSFESLSLMNKLNHLSAVFIWEWQCYFSDLSYIHLMLAVYPALKIFYTYSFYFQRANMYQFNYIFRYMIKTVCRCFFFSVIPTNHPTIHVQPPFLFVGSVLLLHCIFLSL